MASLVKVNPLGKPLPSKMIAQDFLVSSWILDAESARLLEKHSLANQVLVSSDDDDGVDDGFPVSQRTAQLESTESGLCSSGVLVDPLC